MCLSPEVDVVAAAAIAVIAVDALRHCHARRTAPLALLPSLFAAHTLTEAFIWWGADGTVPDSLASVATWLYILVAFVLLPVYVPVAVLLLEPHGTRRTLLLVLTGVGAIAGGLFLVGLIDGRATATVCDRFIDYTIEDTASGAGVLYIIATCGALLLSGERPLMLWGIVNVLAIAAINLWSAEGLPSIWCLWAAVTSGFVAWYLRHLDAAHARGEPWPWLLEEHRH